MTGFQPIKGNDFNSILITNDKIVAMKAKDAPKKEAMEMWSEVKNQLTHSIENVPKKSSSCPSILKQGAKDLLNSLSKKKK